MSQGDWESGEFATPLATFDSKTYCRRRNDLRSRLCPFTMCIYRIAARYTLIVSALTERARYVAKYTSIFSFVGRIWFGSMCSL